MIALRLLLLSSLCLPLMVMASAGSWSGQSAGGQLSVGRQNMTSRPLAPALPLSPAARVRSFSWRITTLSAPPPGLQIALCSQNRCVPLNALSGREEGGQDLSVDGPFYFLYRIKTRGQLSPPLTVVSNQLTINYH